MACQILLSQKGPLPIKVTFNAESDGPTCLEVNGSVWTLNANTMIGIAIQVDGQAVGAAQIFSNQPSTHRAAVPAFIPLQLGFGQHAITLSALQGTTSDFNDFYVAMIHY